MSVCAISCPALLTGWEAVGLRSYANRVQKLAARGGGILSCVNMCRGTAWLVLKPRKMLACMQNLGLKHVCLLQEWK